MKRFKIFFIVLCSVLAAKAQSIVFNNQVPKHEVRAVWLTTIGGIDWPHSYAQSSYSAEKQKKELTDILDRLQQAKINTVLIQTRVRGTMIYPSAYEPWDGCLSGFPGRSPGYDALQFAIDECHKRGMKVMLDAVFNHIGDSSPQWQDVLAHGEDSQYVDWFHINEFPASYKRGENFEDAYDITYDVFAANPHMPKLNTANPEVQDYLLNIARYWIEAFDIDAWRLDVANEVDHAFWKKFRIVCDEAKKDFYILGEIWHSSQNWLQGDEFHAVMNYAFTDAIMGYFVKNELSLSKMVSEMNNQLMLYRNQTNQMQFNILDSHDTPRLLTEANEDKDVMKQAMAFTYIQPGVPCLYYGDEIGLTGGMDPDCRKCMVWEEEKQDRDLHRFVKELNGIRKEQQKILSEGTVYWRQVSEESGVVIFERMLGGEVIRGAFNTGEHTARVELIGEALFSNLADVSDGAVELARKGFVLMKE